MRWILAIALLLFPALAFAGGAGVTAAVTFVGKVIGGATVGGAFFAAAFTFVVSKAASMMSREDRAQPFSQGRTQTVRQEAAPRQIIYGETRVGGTYTFMRVTDNNRYFHMVITLSGHEVENIGDIYYDGDVMEPDGGDIISKFRGERDSGDVTVNNGRFEVFYPQQAGDIDLTEFRIGTIVNVSGMANAVNNGDHRVTDIVEDVPNSVTYMEVETTLTDEAETAATFQSDYVKINKHLGAPNQAADDDLVRLIDDWTTDHRQRECAYIYVRVRWNRDKWPTGIPNFSAVVKGKNDIFDPRDSSTGYSDNPALCINDFLTWERYGFGADYATEINEAELIASANVCDENVRLANVVGAGDFVVGTTYEIKTVGTTDFTAIGASSNTVGVEFTATGSGSGTGDAYEMETRYTCNGAMSSGTKIAPNLNAIMGSMAGETIWSGGQWYILAGYYRTPSVTFDESDMTGGLSVITGISRSQLFNSIKGTYVSPENRYIEAGFPAVTNATYVSNDGGEKSWENIELPFTDSPSMAQRIAKIQLEQVRQQITVAMPVNLKGLRVKAGDVVKVTNARMGWTEKPFEVTDWELALDSADENPIFGVNLELRETASGVYDWNSGEETTVDLAPDTDLPDPFSVTAPTNLTVKSGTAQLYRKKDGTVVTRTRMDWTASVDSFVQEYEVQYKRFSDTEWQAGGKPEGEDAHWYIWDVEDGEDYDHRIRAINPFGPRSDWLTVTNHTVIGKTEPPPDVRFLNVTQDGESVAIGWSRVFVNDLQGYEVRYGERGISTWDDSLIITEAERGTRTTKADIPPGDWRFFIKAIDTSGNESVEPATRDYEVTTGYQDIYSLQHHDTWPGERVNFDLVATLLEPTNTKFAYYAGETVDLDYNEKRRIWAGLSLITQSVDETEDYGLITQSVTETDDYLYIVGDIENTTQTLYGSINDTVDTTTNYGLITGTVSTTTNYGSLWAASNPTVVDWGVLSQSVPRGDSRVSYQIATRKAGENWTDPDAAQTDYGSINGPVTTTTNYGLITGSADTTTTYDTIIPWQEWQKGQKLHRYVKQRVVVESDEGDGLLLVRRFLEKVDFEQRTERHSGEAIASTGTTITFDKRFHFVPTAVAEVQSTGALYPVKSDIDEFGVTYFVRDETGAKVSANNLSFTVTGV